MANVGMYFANNAMYNNPDDLEGQRLQDRSAHRSLLSQQLPDGYFPLVNIKCLGVQWIRLKNCLTFGVHRLAKFIE
jgi:hypothetical protein